MTQAEHTTHTGQHGHGHMHEEVAHGPTRGTFITIWLTLGFLTVVEIMVPTVYSAEWNHHIKVALLLILAIGKAMLVGLFFMHLKWEKPWLKRIALLPAYMGLAAILLMLEEAFRNSLS